MLSIVDDPIHKWAKGNVENKTEQVDVELTANNFPPEHRDRKIACRLTAPAEEDDVYE